MDWEKVLEKDAFHFARAFCGARIEHSCQEAKLSDGGVVVESADIIPVLVPWHIEVETAGIMR